MWQDEYLEALANEDEGSATVLIAEMDQIRTDLGVITVDALIAFRGDADILIVNLAADFDTYLIDVAA